MSEAERIRAVYARRSERGLDARYSYWEPANLYTFQQRERAVVEVLGRHSLLPLGERRVLDVGCGDGSVLRGLLRYGARPENLEGIDLLPERIERARELSPNLDFSEGDAAALPCADSSFDLTLAFTLFSSILDEETRRQVAGEMLRVLRPGGLVLLYDFWLNPRNPDVRPLGKREARALFPGCRFDWRRVTLAPPLARLLAPRSWLVCYLLEKLPFLRTHYLVAIRKEGS
jgi:SAM-dependent methyltransferase